MLTIVSGGISYYTIALCTGATNVEQTAATELQSYIFKITGKTLVIVAEGAAQDKSFMIGPTAFALTKARRVVGLS